MFTIDIWWFPEIGVVYNGAFSGWWYTYPSENMSSSVAMMTFPTEWKVIRHPWFQSPPSSSPMVDPSG